MARAAGHLSVSKLERRFVDCADPVEVRRVQVIWLLAQGHTVGPTSKVTAFGSRRVDQMLDRHNASGLRTAFKHARGKRERIDAGPERSRRGGRPGLDTVAGAGSRAGAAAAHPESTGVPSSP